jgi:hypothetical protein
MSIQEEYAEVPEDLDAPPKLFVNIVNVYNALLKDSGIGENGTVVWTGPLTSFVEEKAGVSQSQYSRVIGTLREMQCIGQLRRGSGSVHSKWAMLGPPTYENYKHQRRKAGYRREKKVDPTLQKVKMLEREIAFLNVRLERMLVSLGKKETQNDVEEIIRIVDERMEAGGYVNGEGELDSE